MSQLPGSGVFTDLSPSRGSIMLRRLRASIVFILFAGSGIGLTALVTGMAEQSTTPLVNATSSPQPLQAQQGVRTTALKAQTKLKPIPAKANQSTATSSTAKAPGCTQQGRNNAAKAYRDRLNTEARRHTTTERTIERSGWMSRILNPGVYRYRLDQESGTHQAALHTIFAQYQTDLTNAHCNS